MNTRLHDALVWAGATALLVVSGLMIGAGVIAAILLVTHAGLPW